MEKFMKGYVFRLYPNKEQIKLIEKSFGCSRYIYNYFLERNKNYINAYEMIKELPKLVSENNLLSEVEMYDCKVIRVKIYFDFCSIWYSSKVILFS